MRLSSDSSEEDVREVIPIPDSLGWVEDLRPSQQFVCHVGTEPLLPGYYQYFLGREVYLAQGYNTKKRVRNEPPDLSLRSRRSTTIPAHLPDSLGKGAMLIDVFTGGGYLKG